jgi:hypothetical protein
VMPFPWSSLSPSTKQSPRPWWCTARKTKTWTMVGKGQWERDKSVQPLLGHFPCLVHHVQLRLKFLFQGLHCLLQQSNLAVLCGARSERQR